MTRDTRRGVTLVELLVAVTIASILGSALMTLMLSMNRFEEQQEGLRSARRVGRGAVNVMLDEMRMVDPEWGIESASATSVTVRVPYALGLTCSSTSTVQTLLLLPADSVALVQPGLSGFAYRSSSGAMTPVTTSLTVAWPGTVPSACGSAGIQSIPAPTSAPNAKTRPVTLTGSGFTVLTAGTPVMLYRRTRFYFGASAQSGLSGRTALWRDELDDASNAQELAGPFDAAAAFRFYNLDATTAQTSAPALTNIHGFEFYLPGESDRTGRNRSGPEQADMTTSVFFVNRRN